MLKFLIMGAGSIGERHLGNLKSIAPAAEISVYDTQRDRLADICQKHTVEEAGRDDIDSPQDCVLVCTPPISHTELAIRALAAGSNVFIEKPLSSNLRGVDRLALVAKRKKLLAFVGYNFRFNKGIRMVKELVQSGRFGRVVHASAYFGQYLPDWRPWQDYTKSYTARKKMGGGIIYDGSHEVDYLSWLLGAPSFVQSSFSTTDMLAADSEAMADVLLKFDRVPACLHLDFVRREYKRSLELLCENGIIQWSLSEDTVRTFDAVTKQWNVAKLDENVNDMYVSEMRHVLSCLESGKKSTLIDLQNGVTTLRVSDAIRRSGVAGKRILL